MTWDEAASFDLPTLACDALDFSTLRERAKAIGLSHPTFEYSRSPGRPGYVHITTRVGMAAFMAENLRALALAASELQKPDVLIACTHGIAEILKELETHDKRGQK